MSTNNSQRAVPAPELSATMTGSWVELGEFVEAPTHVIFDNQSTVSVAISFDGGTNTWKTFSAGAAIVMDLRAAAAHASNFLLPKGMPIWGNGASGDFFVSYIYAYNG